MADAMAASSGGVDWSSVLKPLLSANYETSNKTELIELCSAIIKSEAEILRHKESNRHFFNVFAVIAADYIGSSTAGLLTSQLETVNAACRVLLKYLLNALNASCSELSQNTSQIERYLNAIRVLCIGTGLLSTSEVTVLVDSMKGENLPQHGISSPTGNEKDTSNKQDNSKNRSDLSVSIFEQLTLPLRDGHTTTHDQGASGSHNITEISDLNDPTSEINKLFLKGNTESLQSLRAGDTLIDLCLSLPSIKKAKLKVEEALAGKPFSLPSNHAEATTLRNSISSMLSEIKLAMSAINLPVLEPLTSSKLDKLCSLAMAALYGALSQAVASAVISMSTVVSPKCSNQQSQAGLKEDDLDSNAVSLVEEVLNMYSFIGSTIKISTRAGGHVYQNYLLAGAWVLISGLQTHLATSTSSDKNPHLREREEKGRSPCKSRDSTSTRSGLQKFQQSFGVLSVALATRALSLISELFEDLHLEVCGGAGSIVQVEPAPLAIMGQFSSLQRVSRILSAAPLNHLLFYLAIVSYRKACTLKRLHPPEGDTFSQSDSTTYYEDMIMCSDESSTDEDDDSEPILGQWFEETLAPPETMDTKTPSSSENVETKASQSERMRSVVPEKGEAHGYITLATNIFVFMNKHFLCSKSNFIARYVKNGLTEQQMIILSAIIRDLDKETARTEVGTIPVYFGAVLGQLYSEFSGALTRFTHNLITNNNLATLQACLLNHLGVSPWNTDVPHGWPLQVYPRTLAVLAQVLLLRPQNEKEASVISIWHRLVNTLIENVLNNPQVSAVESENDDLNVEHAQVLLYLFHTLNLMQKKSVVLLMAGGVLRCSEVARGPLKDAQLLHLSRLLLLFDYIMKHLYDAPTSLLEQIQWNLFHATKLNTNEDNDSGITRMYSAWQDIEENYRKISSADEFALKPRFYVLTNLEINNQDAPKLDGLACNFIQGTPDKLRYPLLLDALIEILNITHVTSGSNAAKMSFLGLCATQYCFMICWRLLQLLPPSASYMERLTTGENLAIGPLLLHSLIWGPRASHKNFCRWLKDCLVKQGMYTQHTDKLLKAVSEAVNNVKYDISNAKTSIIALTPDVKKGLVTKENLPPLWHIYLLDSLLAKVQVSIGEPEGNSESASIYVLEGTHVQDLLPHVLRLTQAILHCLRWSVLHIIVDQSDASEKLSLQDFEGIQDVLAVASTKNILTNTIASELTTLMPSCISSAQLQAYKPILDEVSLASYKSDIIPSETFILKVVDAHVSTLSMSSPFSINLSLKRLLLSLTNFICDHAPKAENTDTKNKAIEMLVSITLDMRTEYLHDTVSKTLDKMIGDTETDEHQKRVYLRVLDHTYKLIINSTSPSSGNYGYHITEEVLHHCLKFYEKILEKSSGRQALESFFVGDKDLVKVLMSVSSSKMSQQYSTRVLHFFNKLFQAAEKSSTDPSLNYLCSSMSKIAKVDSEKLQIWLRQIIIGSSNILLTSTTETVNKGETPSSNDSKWTITTADSKENSSSPTPNEEQKSLVQENSQLLQSLTSFIVKQNSNVSEDVSITILKALIQLGRHLLSPALEGAGFTDLMVDMTMLADAGSGKGHIFLFPATVEWIEMCYKRISIKEVTKNVSEDSECKKPNTMLEAASCILEYVSEVITGITFQLPRPMRTLSPPWESESPLDLEFECQDFTNDDDESGEDSDEDSLCNKLCTFTVTQKEFMNQHWYHCHTCRMLDGVGVCSVCAKVCHKGHDLSYAKYGNFFCDCGAKDDGSCQALVKRSPQSVEANQTIGVVSSQPSLGLSSEQMLTSSLRRRTSSPILSDKVLYNGKKSGCIVKQLNGSKEFIINYLGSTSVTASLLEFLQTLIPAVEETCRQHSPVGCHVRGVKALEQLHYNNEKKYVHTDHLMVPTLGSQEGAFENVRMSYAGEQGQTIRQLLSAHIVRRVAMCCMTSTQGRRQHLAVSHEKGKITVLQLSALLKQADSSTRKLTLTRLSTAPIPFTVISLSSNLCNEDFLVVCGLKDCHVLTFTSGGSVSDHLVLHPQLETGNFIIKALWLPGSQTELALITADFVKIYDLAIDASSPQYFFLVPSGKIRDCTFMFEDGIYHILLMSSPGHIYTEVLNEDSSTKYGTFYVTNTLDVYHLDITDVNGQVAGGGVSIYYSHTLGLLFYSYAQGKSYISPIQPKNNTLPLVFPITLPTPNNNTSKSNGSRNASNQPLCQWTEIPNHPGLICCAMQSSNNPVILMLKPDSIMIQEIRVVPSKSKIMDMVAIRHSSGNDLRTTLILLCEDGSLKMYMANMEQTGFWMSRCIQATLPSTSLKPKKKKVVKSGSKTSNTITFPVDFFENCVVMSDIELGGNDLLQIYNQAQLKHRLNTTGLYVACNKPLGFSIDITNNDSNMVLSGIRVLVGSQDIQKCPSFVEIFGRIVPFSTTRSRWYDIPFSREESLQADKKLTILFGPSQDPETVTMVDNLKVFGKTKDSFGWPEETEENGPSTGNVGNQPVVPAESAENIGSTNQLSKLEKLVVGILESLDGTFLLHFDDQKLFTFRPTIIKAATQLLTLPTQPSIQMHSKSLLSVLHSTRTSYYSYKDQAMLEHVMTSLNDMTSTEVTELDAESYYRLVLIVRGIAVARPQNLIKFSDSHTSIQDIVLEDPLEMKQVNAKELKGKISEPKNQHLLLQLMDVLWILHSLNPEIPALSLVVSQGLRHTEQVVHALIDIVHAFNGCDTYSHITIGVYLQLLLCEDPLIAFSAKQALSKALKPKSKKRKVYIPSPPLCISPPPKNSVADDSKIPTVAPPIQGDIQQRHQHQYDVDAVEAIGLLEQPGHVQDIQNVNPLEALLGGGIGFAPLLDIPPDADDEAMVELAIALSLQEHDIGGDQNQTLQSLQVQMSNDVLGHHAGQTAQAQEVANLSDTTASAAGSDDEESTAATDGSTLRTSPAEQGGSAGSESGGSGVESITGEHNVSGRSSAYGDNMQETINLVSRSDTSSIANTTTGIPEPETAQHDVDIEFESSSRLHNQRLQLLERLIEYLPKLRNINGTRVIPFLQVVLQLTAELDGTCERDRVCLDSLLKVIVAELQLNKDQTEDVCTRTKQREVQLVLLRLLSIFMQRCKSAPASKGSVTDNSSFISRTTATILHKTGIIKYCNKLLQSLLSYWRTLAEESPNEVTGNLLKENLTQPPPDMTPFFQRQFVKDNHDVFLTYPQLLTEIALRLPYQVHRHSEISESINNAFDVSWYNLLCDYMMTPQTPFVRRQVRKLLMFICGNKETYRQLRDLHGLKNHMKGVQECCMKGGFQPTMDVQHALGLPYDSLVELIEHLKYCVEVAQSRTGNWQRFCMKEDGTIQFLLRVSFLLDDGVAPTILQLLQSALVINSMNAKKPEAPKQVSRKDREKSEDLTIEAHFEESSGIALVELINNQVSREVFARFVKTFMLETNITSVRWQAHALVQSIYKNSNPKNQESILELLWQLWPLLPAYGRKAAQFVDLLGYFSLKFTEKPEGVLLIPEYVERAVGILRAQNEMLAHHPNANLYAHMSQFVDLDGYFLESEPCLVCNNPEVSFSTIKLSSIKVDSKFTTTTQIVKLLSSHTISKITIRIADLKRTKMVRTVNIYYNNRTVQAVVELKNKPALWHKAKKITLQSGQTEVKIEFPLPIIACNLMVEYADFYENIQASSETLQCPRCSASVPANPGVCANCGENVFQCHKCRAINYDEKDPFLCHACGFCKYAKFDFSLYAKPCCAVEPIENDEDRKKTVAGINTLLEKADRVYKQLIANKPTLESLVLRISEHRSDKRLEEVVTTSNSTSNATASTSAAGTQLKVNKTIQLLGQQYCIECKTSFEELSKIIQKVMVSRKELVAYDRKHRDMELPKSTPVLGDTSVVPCINNRCYGCSTSATEHCLTLLRALAHNPTTRKALCQEGLIQELVWNNLRKGTVHNQEEVRQLLCVLTKDNSSATEELCILLMEKITLSLNGHVNSSDLGTSVRHEIALLAAMVQKEDECWELKLRCMMRLFLKACEDSRSPLVMESVILPCLKILQGLMKPLDNTNKKSKEKENESPKHTISLAGTTVDVHKFLEKDAQHTFDGWKARLPNTQDITTSGTSREETRSHYLKEKYGRMWRRTVKKTYVTEKLTLHDSSWLKAVIFNPSSRLARQVSCNIIEVMCSSFERKREILNLLTHFLMELSIAGESSAEFLALYQNLIQEVPWKQYLTVHGVLLVLAHLVTVEIEKLHKLEETTLTSDLAQGFALNQLTELLSSFLDDATIRRQYKGRLVGAVLNGYLSLRRLVVQRTRLIDETQEKLLELLEEMTSGTEEETEAFMSICIKTVGKYSLQDVLTPVFIFERLCSIIYPEENDVGEFFLTLEKDPQQEDFLQGRMLGNPYSSMEAGLGPLMRDVKNKICQDCELVALLEDDNGMELLVNNKIMSLDLPVKDVYKKVWIAEGGDHEAMRIIYRMRGLLGDATEEFIESLNNKTQNAVDNEDVFKMANVLAYCGGLQMMVIRLGAIQNVYRARPLLQVLLKLFRLCVKVNRCQEVLIQPEIGAMEVFLRTLKLCLDSDPDSSQAAVTEQLLDIMETVLSKATSQPFEKFKELSHTFGSPEYVKSLLTCTNQSVVKNNIAVQEHLTRVLAALVYGNEEKMKILIDHFNSALYFNKYDFEHNSEDQQKLEMFCVLTNGIEKNAIGNTFKDYIISLDIVKNALEYITMHAPCVKPTLLRVDSDELKDFISKPALKYVLRFLTGLAHSHEKTQLTIAAADTISIIHRVEQVSSDEHVGSLAENLLEALCTNPEVAKQIDAVRDFTRSEKKRLAMAMREKQLGQLGMRTNDKGQVTAKSTILQQIEELGEESGLVCCICREGYKYQPTKVLGLYTFTKRCNIEEFEAKPRKTVGYTTVTHFNIVHIDCHMSAVRLARARDEWESAALQNANTKCNGLLPLWGPQVPESAFASCLARHNTYLQESTNHRDIGHSSTIHDLKILLMKFALEKSFHEDTGGGGPQSNMHMVPYLIHVALYVINTTRVSKREEASLMSYLESTNMEKWVESAYESEGPLYWTTMSILLHSFSQWTENRIRHLRRLIILAHARHCQPTGPAKSLSDKTQKSHSVYKPYLVFFGLVDGIYKYFFKNISGTDEQWPNNLADYIRHNDEALLKSSEKLLTAYTDDLLPCTSFIEFCDVTGMLDLVNNPDTYIKDLLSGLF